MDQPKPEWLTTNFFTECLRKERSDDSIVVSSFELSPAAPPGNNYGSYIVRAKVEFTEGATDRGTQVVSLIVKAELTQGPFKDMSTEIKLNEPSFYYKFIPAANKFTDVKFAVKSYFSPKPDVTVLEDLKENGFVMADRIKQLDFHHCRLYMTAAAEFHAVSVAVLREHPDLFEPVKNINIYTEDSTFRDIFEKMIHYGMKCFADAVGNIEKFQKYSGLLRDLTPRFWDLLVEANKSSKFLKTMRQGDPWTTNMMFKYNEDGEVCEIKIIDFQATFYGSPVNDIVFFIWSSANNDVKKTRLRELFSIYADALNENLSKLNCTERVSYEEMEEEVKLLTPAAMFSIPNLPAILNPEPMKLEDVFTQDDEDKAINVYRKGYTEHFCKNYLPDLLESLEINGVFRFLESKRL